MSLDVSFAGVPGRSDHNWTAAVTDTLHEVEGLLGNVQAVLDLSDDPKTPGRWLAAICHEVVRLHGEDHRQDFYILEDEDAPDKVDSTGEGFDLEAYGESIATAAELARVANVLIKTHGVVPDYLRRRVEVFRVHKGEHGDGRWDTFPLEVGLVPAADVTDEMLEAAYRRACKAGRALKPLEDFLAIGLYAADDAGAKVGR